MATVSTRSMPANRAWESARRTVRVVPVKELLDVVKQLESFDFKAIPALNKMLVLEISPAASTSRAART